MSSEDKIPSVVRGDQVALPTGVKLTPVDVFFAEFGQTIQKHRDRLQKTDPGDEILAKIVRVCQNYAQSRMGVKIG